MKKKVCKPKKKRAVSHRIEETMFFLAGEKNRENGEERERRKNQKWRMRDISENREKRRESLR